MHRGIDACFADEEVMIYYWDMVLGQLHICVVLES